ncbi:NAD(P)-binding protein [Bradyrhizobium quebecense]|uniref:FAD-dependent monooxygenase n=1 Tax=Bradyrhizobium quebecense TaxID=2748629 RepID=A0ACD3V245_9BRAD|nr:NAD(P)-binding protein [Bradyrhizobium quebecense]UGA42134.1 FAD-dependent monooxygenase [Bradyrhizobium quebecense]UGY00409.1 FAD-dependent monooxygenase [Bradyrhizobium quebecense]
MGAVKTVFIVGGGIGGLTVAHALLQIGASTRVIEVGDKRDRIGTQITLLGNTLLALAELGLVDACLEGGLGWDFVSVRDGAGTILSEQSTPRIWDADRPGALGIMRPRLGQILEDFATKGGAKIDSTQPSPELIRTMEG